MYKEIEGDLFAFTEAGEFDVIAQGCNCFCTQKKGIAVEFVKRFSTDEFEMEQPEYKGDINKLGCIEYDYNMFTITGREMIVVNCYTEYSYKRKNDPPDLIYIDYDALKLCFRKMNHVFKGKRIGLPKIGAGLAGGDWDILSNIIKTELIDCDITVVIKKVI